MCGRREHHEGTIVHNLSQTSSLVCNRISDFKYFDLFCPMLRQLGLSFLRCMPYASDDPPLCDANASPSTSHSKMCSSLCNFKRPHYEYACPCPTWILKSLEFRLSSVFLEVFAMCDQISTIGGSGGSYHGCQYVGGDALFSETGGS